MNYELTFLFDCVFDDQPQRPFDIMITRELSEEVIELINNHNAVITKIITM